MKRIIAAALVLSMCFPAAPATAAKVCQSNSFAGFPVPDYANKESTNRISANNGTWTAAKSGYVALSGAGYADSSSTWHTITFSVNNLAVEGGQSFTSGGAHHTESALLPVAKGDVIKISVAGVFDGASCYFIPPKFVAPNM
jgi:hypothetical protein